MYKYDESKRTRKFTKKGKTAVNKYGDKTPARWEYKYTVYHMDGSAEVVVGSIYFIKVDGVRKVFLDRWPNGEPPDWPKRWNEFTGRTDGLYYRELMEQAGSTPSDFKNYYVMERGEQVLSARLKRDGQKEEPKSYVGMGFWEKVMKRIK